MLHFHPVLHVLENRVEAFHPVPIEQAEVAYHPSHCPGRVGLLRISFMSCALDMLDPDRWGGSTYCEGTGVSAVDRDDLTE